MSRKFSIVGCTALFVLLLGFFILGHNIERVLNRITLVGALYLSAVCVLPVLLSNQFGIPFFFGGTALLIVVGVGMDTVAQIEAHLVSRNYESLMRGTRIRGRGGR